jgi:hypothetical protein
MVRFINWYLEKLHRAAQHDPVVSVAFLQVVNLMAAPPSVMRPGIVWRVLRGNLLQAAKVHLEIRPQPNFSVGRL